MESEMTQKEHFRKKYGTFSETILTKNLAALKMTVTDKKLLLDYGTEKFVQIGFLK